MTAGILSIGVILALVAGVATGAPPLLPADAALAAVAGLAGGGGLLLLYHGLSTGRMAVVAPMSGLLSAAVPATAGSILEGVPGPLRAVGILLALVAVVLVSRSGSSAGRRDGVLIGLAAGTLLGLYSILVAGLTPGHIWYPLAVARIANVTLVVALILVLRRSWRIPRGAAPIVILAGFADATGNATYFIATQAGRLDVAAVLSALFPVTTILLAVVILRERVGRGQLVGIVLAIAAVALIAGG